MSSKPKKILFFIFLFLVVASSFRGCSGQWTGVVYADRQNLSNYRLIGVFDSLENCRSEAIYALRQISPNNDGDYECGLNCEGSVCKKTAR